MDPFWRLTWYTCPHEEVESDNEIRKWGREVLEWGAKAVNEVYGCYCQLKQEAGRYFGRKRDDGF
jgi:hypothetical protein